MLSLSFDSLSTKQQYTRLKVVPALNDSIRKIIVDESVDDWVQKRPRLADMPQKKSPDTLAHAGAPMFQIR